MLDEAYDKAKALLDNRRNDLDAGARLLLEKETLTPEEFPPLLPLTPASASYRPISTPR